MLESLRVGSYIVDCLSKTLLLNGQRVPITKRQFETLQVLLSANGETVDRETFLETVWADTIVEDSNLTQTIFMLRRLLGTTPNGDEYIETVTRKGYRLSSAALELIRPIPVGETISIDDMSLTETFRRNQTVGWQRFLKLAISYSQKLLAWSEANRFKAQRAGSLNEGGLVLVSEEEGFRDLESNETSLYIGDRRLRIDDRRAS